MNVEDSILLSVKKMLGLTEGNEDFDPDITMNINAAIMSLSQIGVGPVRGFIVTNKDNTYEEWLGDFDSIAMVKMYLYSKVRLGFDPPTSSGILECLKETAREMECRLSYRVDPEEALFVDEEVNNDDDELLHPSDPSR